MAQSYTQIKSRAIKTALESAFGKGKVAIRSSRGTAYGYVTAYVDWTPLDYEQSNRMQAECKALLRAAGIDLGRAYTDDTCQWESDKCRIEFNAARYYRTMKHSDGTMSALADRWDSEWQLVA